VAAECFPNEDYGLPSAKAILVDREQSNFLMECGEDYFLWNDVSNDIARIDEPKGLPDILQVLSTPEKLKCSTLKMSKAAELS